MPIDQGDQDNYPIEIIFQVTLHYVKLKVDDAKENGYNLKVRDGQSKGRSLGCLSQEQR